MGIFKRPIINSLAISLGVLLIVFLLVRTDRQATEGQAAEAQAAGSQRAIQALVERQAEAWRIGDAEMVAADFAEDAKFVVGTIVTIEGRDAIKGAALDYFANYTDTQVEIIRVISDGNHGVVRWDWSDRHRETNARSKAEDAILFEIQEGKIVYWREFIDKVDDQHRP
ncbi:MAG: nuclear transport factor 2 family protein [Planctomycetota bacterium]